MTEEEYLGHAQCAPSHFVRFQYSTESLIRRASVAAVSHAADLVYRTDGVVIQPDSKSDADARLASEALAPKSDGGFLEVSFLFLCADAHCIFLLWGCALFAFVWK